MRTEEQLIEDLTLIDEAYQRFKGTLKIALYGERVYHEMYDDIRLLRDFAVSELKSAHSWEKFSEIAVRSNEATTSSAETLKALYDELREKRTVIEKPADDNNRCVFEQYIVKYFGMNPDTVTEKTVFSGLDFGNLCDLLCGFKYDLEKFKWIPVAERLPERRKPSEVNADSFSDDSIIVEVCIGEHGHYFAYYSFDQSCWYDIEDSRLSNVTHWKYKTPRP